MFSGKPITVSLIGFLVLIALLCSFIALATATEITNMSPARRSLRVEDRALPKVSTGGVWAAMLSFDQPATYEYRLWRFNSQTTSLGSLKITIAPQYVAFAYDVDGQRDGVVARGQAATLGETLMAALLVSGKWSIDDINLFWTPFIVTRWANELSQMQLRQGPVWAVRSTVTEQFTVSQMLRDSRDNTILRGHLQRSSGFYLDVDINPKLPLPEYIRWADNTGNTYEAEIVWPEPV